MTWAEYIEGLVVLAVIAVVGRLVIWVVVEEWKR